MQQEPRGFMERRGAPRRKRLNWGTCRVGFWVEPVRHDTIKRGSLRSRLRLTRWNRAGPVTGIVNDRVCLQQALLRCGTSRALPSPV